MPIAAIALDFDPILRLGDITIRWQTVALAAVVLLALCLTALNARRAGLRADDLLFVVVGAVPGAVLAGRLGSVLGHADYYAVHPGAIVDPAQGTLTLALAVAGGTITGSIVARLLGTRVRSWLHAAAVPLLLAIGLGKLAMVLAGSGQGQPADVDWATSYAGEGPWGSLAAEIAAHPSQAYEGIVALVVAVVVGSAMVLGVDRKRTGRLFLLGVALWALGRAAIGSTWRDAPIVGPLRAEQLIALGLAAACAVLLLVPVADADPHADEARLDAEQPAWPDPAERPRF